MNVNFLSFKNFFKSTVIHCLNNLLVGDIVVSSKNLNTKNDISLILSA